MRRKWRLIPGLQDAGWELDWAVVWRVGRKKLDDKASLLDDLLNARIELHTDVI